MNDFLIFSLVSDTSSVAQWLTFISLKKLLTISKIISSYFNDLLGFALYRPCEGRGRRPARSVFPVIWGPEAPIKNTGILSQTEKRRVWGPPGRWRRLRAWLERLCAPEPARSPRLHTGSEDIFLLCHSLSPSLGLSWSQLQSGFKVHN